MTKSLLKTALLELPATRPLLALTISTFASQPFRTRHTNTYTGRFHVMEPNRWAQQ